MVYLLKMVIFHGYVSHNQMLVEDPMEIGCLAVTGWDLPEGGWDYQPVKGWQAYWYCPSPSQQITQTLPNGGLEDEFLLTFIFSRIYIF